LSLPDALAALAAPDGLGNAAPIFFEETLQLPLKRITNLPIPAETLLGSAWHPDFANRLNRVYSLGLIDDLAFSESDQASSSTPMEQAQQEGWTGMLLFAVELHPREHNQAPSRTELSHIIRAFNRASNAHPAVILFHYPTEDGVRLSLATCERHAYLQEWREGERPGRIALLRDINPSSPHTGHIRILNRLVTPTTGRNAIRDFEGLHAHWRGVFDIDVLNKAFYKELSDWFFWACREATFPGAPEQSLFTSSASFEAAHQTHQATSVIRLITRMLFAWFLKEKKLIPAELFDPADLAELIDLDANHSSVYKGVLQNIFFATLNQEADQRKFRSQNSGSHYSVTTLYRYEKLFRDPEKFLELQTQIPFLNCGLFECQDKPDPEKKTKRGGPIIHRRDGFSDRDDNPLAVPNVLFLGDEQEVDFSEEYGRAGTTTVRGLFNILNRYTFTITENTPLEQDVALDPELLGKVFENLLASYNPETKSTARKETGSFYTPRDIVDYMVIESLIVHLKERLPEFAPREEELRGLLRDEDAQPFESDSDRRKLVGALGAVTILDPACGSGAFPMGALQIMVKALRKLDPDNLLWKQRQIDEAQQISDPAIRGDVLDNIEAAFQAHEPDYGRKLYLIENCIFGVDIQPIAAQISKLRFFISLMVDQVVDPASDNLGIRPLPNLETKLVAANTLIKLDHSILKSDRVRELEAELADIRHRHFAAKTAKTKAKYRDRDRTTRKALAEALSELGMPEGAASQMASWDPYDQNASAGFFNPEWMFHKPEGFDIVIGNPPYVRQEKFTEIKPLFKEQYPRFTSTADLYVYFYDRAFEVLRQGGVLCYITSNKYFRAGYGKKLRGFMSAETRIHQISDFGDANVFTAIAYPSIILSQQCPPSSGDTIKALNWEEGRDVLSFPQVFLREHFEMPQNGLSEASWQLESKAVLELLEKLKSSGTPLGEYVGGKLYRGIVTGSNFAFVIGQETRDRLIEEDPGCEEIIKPFLRGRDVKRWTIHDPKLFLIFTRRGIDIDKYPSVRRYLSDFRERLEPKPRNWHETHPGEKWPGRKSGSYQWYEIQDNIAYWKEFLPQKIFIAAIVNSPDYAADFTGFFGNDKTSIAVHAHPEFLAAVLSSSCLWWFIKKSAPTRQGGYIELKPSYVKAIPIPNLSSDDRFKIEQWVSKILASEELGSKLELEKRIDYLLYKSFGLSPAEIAIIES